ncbi:MAG: hypothetical protein FK733_02455 [Asgard group archaeon]|nr:hypothetical protein [Asgard group archaeon]
MSFSLVITNPMDAIDQSSWLLLNQLNELLKINYSDEELNNIDNIGKVEAPFWSLILKKLKTLCIPTNLSKAIDQKSLLKKFAVGYNLWSNRNEGYDLDLLNILYFLDTFGLLTLKRKEFDFYEKDELPELDEDIFSDDQKLLINKEVFEIRSKIRGTQRIRYDNPILKSGSEDEFFSKVQKYIYRIVMFEHYYFHLKRRKTIESLKYSELGRFSRIRAKLHEESQKIADVIGSDANFRRLGLAELYVELGLTIPPVEGKIGLKFIKDSKGHFKLEK